MTTKNKTWELLPFTTIQRAMEGDPVAVHKVMDHYENYILKLSTRKMKDEFGNDRYCVDEELRSRLESKLLETIVEFKITR